MITTSLEQFVKHLSDSGLMSDAEIRVVFDFFPPEERPETVEEFARALVCQQKLTKFQAGKLYQGKSAELLFGNYEILDKIGQGGMGMVYQARHRRMKRIVALKTLPPAVTQDEAVVARFHREVEAAARLDHANIVTAFDADEAKGVHFLVMEYVDGMDLSQLVKTHGPLSPADAVNYILQVANGLQYAHTQGVIHRDIKPANLLLDRKGTVKILDMGLARFETTLGQGNDAATEAELTHTGTVMGTADYMSPEQALDAKRADACSDVYSLGCSLHFLLTGKPVYGGGSVIERIIAHRERPIPSLCAVRPDVPIEVDAVFQQMVAKNPGDRYQSMEQVIAALEATGIGGSPAARGAGPAIPRREDSDYLNFLGSLSRESTASKTHKKTKTAEETEVDQSVEATQRSIPGKETSFDLVQNKRALFVGGSLGLALLLAGLVWMFGSDADDKSGLPVQQTGSGKDGAAETPAPPLAKAPFDEAEAKKHQQAWAKHLGVKVETSNSIGMTMRLLPPGEFTMGSPQAEIDELVKTTNNPDWQVRYRSEGPQHQVTLTKPFYLGVYEVTQAEYEQVMGVNPSDHSATGPGKDKVAGLDTGRYPVEMVSWLDAIDFCIKLSEREGLRPCYSRTDDRVTILDGNGYRLPTEAEWEFSCRSGTQTRWCHGDNEQELSEYCNSGRRTHAVGELRSNPFGLYDMHGNVWEWCQDRHAEYGREEATTNPLGPALGNRRVLRGGSFNNSAQLARSADRISYNPAYRYNAFGFRVARTYP